MGLGSTSHRRQIRQDYGEEAPLSSHVSVSVWREKVKRDKKKKKKQPPVINRVTSTMQPRAFWRTCQATAEWGMVHLAILECLPSLVSLLVEN